MAVFKRLRDGKWDGNWWIGYPGTDGKYHREKVGLVKALANEVLAKRLTERAEQKHFPGRVASAQPFYALADKYWELHGSNLKSKTWGYMLNHLRASFGQKKVGAITGGDVQRFYNETLTRTSASTANRHLTLLRSIINKGQSWGDWPGANPCAHVKKEREAAHRLRYLSMDEMDRLLTAAHPRLYPVLVCGLMTGMRRAEILGLTWENVSLEQDTLYILKSKSGKPREVPIPGKLRKVLLDLGPQDSGSVFELPLISMRKYFARSCKAAGIFGFRFHDLRHTFASHFLMRTNDLPTLQRLLGHSSPTLTLRYAHLSKGHLASAVAAFESAIPAGTRIQPSSCTIVAPALAEVAARC